MKNTKKFRSLWKQSGCAKEIVCDQANFLQRLWSFNRLETAFGCLTFRKAGSARFEDQFLAASDMHDLADLLLEFSRDEYDQYFCPNTFSRPSRLAEHVRSTSLGWCDIDEADPALFQPQPSLLWRTSPGRSQGVWFWDKMYPADQAAHYSKALAYRFGGDKGGWSANKLLRLPGSINHKPIYDKPAVRLLSADFTPISKRPVTDGVSVDRIPVKHSRVQIDPFKYDPDKVLRKMKGKLDPIVRSLSRDKSVRMRDRSKQIYVMVVGLHNAGGTPDEIASVVWRSPYFQSKYGESLLALQTEISRILSKRGAEQ